ncbi:hypothetical protein VNO80_02249 [Phaseolus coccineus]|uniref:N-acetyltransferase domain-containing protein n=1 Tax=Phaseolus coccineus TaxID=3886 RepID=A0AAN9RMR0_PHACN
MLFWLCKRWEHKGEEEEEVENVEFDSSEIEYVSYGGEHHLPLIMNLLSFLAFHKGKCVGTVVCKMGEHRNTFRGYIAMLVVIKPYRGRGIATELVTRSIKVMMESGCEEVTLEAEVTNKGALALYGRLGFIRSKRLFHYYLNGVDAFRLKLLFPLSELHPSLSLMADKYENHMQSDQERRHRAAAPLRLRNTVQKRRRRENHRDRRHHENRCRRYLSFVLYAHSIFVVDLGPINTPAPCRHRQRCYSGGIGNIAAESEILNGV